MKTLLITSGLNNDKNSSWLVFSKLIKFFKLTHIELVNIICFTPALFPSQANFNEKIISTFLRDKIITASFNRITRKYSWLIANVYAQLYWKKVLNMIDKEKIERLWVDTDILSLLILKKVFNRTNISFHITVYDDPFTNRFYAPFQTKFEPILKDLFYVAKSIDTPTLMLAEHYRSMGYINENCQISESLVGTFKKQTNPPIIQNEIEKIGLAGSIYGIDALNNFLDVIEGSFINSNIEFHLRTNVPKVYLKYIERYYPAISRNIIIKPFVSENELAYKLQEYDLLYLPMMFDEKYRFKTDTSFPSKTHNYLASGIPIIVHAPESSSLYQFFNKNKIGHLINTLDQDAIKGSIIQLERREYRESLSESIQKFNEAQLENRHVKALYKVITT